MIPIIDAVLGVADTVIKRVWPDPAEQAKAQNALLEIMQRADIAQITVNQAEAANPSVFVAGWRPFIGWVCGGAFAWQFLGLPIAQFGATVAGHPLVGLPELGLDAMMPVLFGMLGMGSLRTYEKVQGVARSR